MKQDLSDQYPSCAQCQSDLQGGGMSAASSPCVPDGDKQVFFYPADVQFLWPVDSRARILDIGGDCGSMSIAAARFHREVHVVCADPSRADVLAKVAREVGAGNLHVVMAPPCAIPFPDQSFDAVILNGFPGSCLIDSRNYASGIPQEVLKEANRVLKDGGCLYVTAQNRWGIQYWMSQPYFPGGGRFTTILPRFMMPWFERDADKMARAMSCLSPDELLRLLKGAGFGIHGAYGTSPHHIRIEAAFPLGMSGPFKGSVKVEGLVPRGIYSIAKFFIPRGLMRYIVPGVVVIGRKGAGEVVRSRLEKALSMAGLAAQGAGFWFVILNNRFANDNSVKFIVYRQGSRVPLYFCKVARTPGCTELSVEAGKLKYLSGCFERSGQGTEKLPRLLFSGDVDGASVLVMSFLKAKKLDLKRHYIVNKFLDRIGVTSKLLRPAMASLEERFFLKRIDGRMRAAIDLLVEFQHKTSVGPRDVGTQAEIIITRYRDLHPDMPDSLRQAIRVLQERLQILAPVISSICAVHGDFCFYNIIYLPDGKAVFLDFEHAEIQGEPFFDLGTLIFNPLIVKWKSSYLKGQPFARYVEAYGVGRYIDRWITYFCEKKGLPRGLAPLIPLLNVLEQNTKQYPSSRDPFSYPMYGAAMISEFLALYTAQPSGDAFDNKV